MTRRVLSVACRDQKGLITRITELIFHYGGNIIENGEFVDLYDSRFYLRAVIDELQRVESFQDALAERLPDARIRLSPLAPRPIVIMATTEAHCLGDLLIRAAFDDLPARVVGVISNHAVLAELTEAMKVPFFHLSHEGISREQHEARIGRVIDELAPDFVVLAKYMRIFSPGFVARYPNRLLNIHHSFLPAFIGANPYRQAWERGVKVIGATAHYATQDLDEGPIIAQDVVSVDHNYSPEDMARYGRDVEKRVLARALRFVLEDRVFVNGNKTIVFE